MKFTLKEYSCAICNSVDSTQPLFKINNFNIVKCKNCQFVYVNPRISNEDLPKLYSGDYFNNKEFGYSGYEQDAHLRIQNFKRWLKDIKPFLEKEKGSVLDIGCASGYFLELMRDNGWSVEGIELDPSMQTVLDKKQIPTFPHPFDEYKTDKKFDLITLFDVIEHLPEVHQTFKKLTDILDEKGIIALITPDYNSFQSKFFGKNWFQLKPQEHIQYFTPATLQKAIEPHGLEIIYISKPGQYADASFLLNRLKKYRLKLLHKIFSFLFKITGITNKSWYIGTGSMFVILGKKIS